MYIRNGNKIIKDTYKCGTIIGNYIMKQGIPLLSRENDIMIFANSDNLYEVINNMPTYLKILMKAGVING